MADEKNPANTPKSEHRRTAGAADFKSFTTFEVEFWLAWEALKNSFLNVLRYVIIAGLFVYLLTAVILLSDIMAFHDRVKSDVGDDSRARRAVLMLHKMHENPDKYPRGDAVLPVGTLAVSLGSLKASFQDLRRFDDFTVRPPEDPSPPLSVKGSATTNDLQTFEILQEGIEEELDKFQKILESDDSATSIKQAIETFKSNHETSKQQHQQQVSPLEARLASLMEDFARLRTSIIGADREITAYDLLKRIQTRMAALIRDIKAPGEAASLIADVEDLEGRIDAMLLASDDLQEHWEASDGGKAAIDGFIVKVSDYAGLSGNLQRIGAGLLAINGRNLGDVLNSTVNGVDEKIDAIMTAVADLKEKWESGDGSKAAIDGFIVEANNHSDLSEDLQRIKQQLRETDGNAIDPIDFSGQLDRLKSDIQSFKGSLSIFPNSQAQIDNLAATVQQIEDVQARPVNETSIVEFLDELEGIEDDIREFGKESPFNPVTPELRKVLMELDQELSKTQKSLSSPQSGDPIDFPPLDLYLSKVEDALDRRYPEHFLIASGLVEDLGALRSHLLTLGTIQPGEYRHDDGDLARGEDAQDLFETRLEVMSEEINDAESKLEKQGRVVALANVLEEDENETAEGAKVKAAGILQDYDALNRFGWLMMPLPTFGLVSPRSPWAEFGLNPLRLATLTTPSITTIYVLVIGAIGSLIYITKYQLKLVVDGHMLRTRPPMPLPWFLFRPIFGVVVALALYFLIRAGQLALGSGTDEEVGTTLNIPVLSVLALFAGILSWQALAMIETRGSVWFKEQSREPLWATGLSNALRTREKSIAECAQQIGRTQEQVGRWLSFKDKVPIELQDRISTWIDMRIDELFGEFKPSERVAGKPMWAVGLRQALDSYDKQIDAEALVELLREDHRPENIERIRAWIVLKQQVPPATQWRLVDLLDVPHHLLFAPEKQNRHVWGTKLRRAIEGRNESVRTVATRMGVQPEQLHAWKELDEEIPPVMQKRLMDVLERSFTQLFEAGDIDDHEGFFKVPLNMTGALKDRNIVPKVFARRIDVEPERVDKWCHANEDERGEIAQPTCDRIERVLEEYGPGPDPFEEPQAALPDGRDDEANQTQPEPTAPEDPPQPRPQSTMGRRKATPETTGLERAMEEEGIEDARGLAKRVYGDKPTSSQVRLVRGWIEGKGISHKNQDRLVEGLKTTHKALFG
ncbi:MAG: hypothetical protein ACR2RA_21430 [Geminicoccaceae bacterium]